MHRHTVLTLALVCGLALPALAEPPSDAERDARIAEKMEKRAEHLRRIHTARTIELGQILGLDTAGTIKLGERLKPYEDQRLALRLSNFEAVRALRQARRYGSGDAVAAAKKLAANRIQLSQVDQQELDEVLKGLSPEKAREAAIFMIEFPRRLERTAGEMRERRAREGDND